MPLASAQAIEGVATLLRGISGLASSVHTARAWPLTTDELPAWRVYGEGEEVTAHGLNFPARQTHELDVRAEGLVRATSDLDDAMHSLAADALAALFASRASTSLAPLNCAMTLQRIDRDMATEGEAAVGRISLSLRVRFHTFSNAPEVIN